MKPVKDTNFAVSYLELLNELIQNPDYRCSSRLGNMNEIINYTFKCPLEIDWAKFHEKFPHWNYEYAQAFFSWMMSGSTDMKQLALLNPSVYKFMPGSEIPANFSTAYGPRLLSQFGANLAEFANVNSRRTVFHILDKGDDFIRSVTTNLEYPCCSNIVFFKRNSYDSALPDKPARCFVDVVATFRSSNCYITMLYDVYNIANFARAFVKAYEVAYDTALPLTLGTLNMQLASAHLYHTNLEHAKKLTGCY